MASAIGGKLIGRFTGVTPITLFRMQGSTGVRLRLEAAAKTAGRTSFDISATDGLVHARDPAEERFLGPNGMSMRPKGIVLGTLLSGFRAANTFVFEVPAGTPIPPELVLFHEHSDHYSVQPAASMTPAKLNAALTAFLSQPQVVRHEGKLAFYAAHPDMTPDALGFSRYA